MNRNHLKIIACVSMLADHIGFLLFPQLTFLRWAGRLAMPLFAFFIGEGSVHTSNRTKYLSSVLILGFGCQCFYIGEELIRTGMLNLYSDSLYLNILFTFVFAILGCYGICDIKKDRAEGNKNAADFGIALTVLYTLCLGGICAFLYFSRQNDGTKLYLDYGICGILLPMSVTLFDERKKKLAAFSAMLLIYCIVFMRETPYVWFSLLCIPLLAIYNGKAGSKKLKYLFYVFYPVHFAVLYLLQTILYS